MFDSKRHSVTGLAAVLAISFSFSACSGGGGGGGAANPEDTLNSSGLVLPANAYTLTNPAEDSNVVLTGSAGPTMKMIGGTKIAISLPFTAGAGSNVVGVGIRFGLNGKINVIPGTPTDAGTIAANITVTPAICANLSKICHDIKCYEFAVTSAGKISKANIQAVALACGGCNIPSCKSLLSECNSGGGGGGPGTMGFTVGGTTYNATSPIAVNSTGVHCTPTASVLAIAGTSGSATVILHVPTNVTTGTKSITANCAYHAQITATGIVMAVYQNHPFGGSGTITVTTKTATTIAGSFTFTGRNLSSSGNITCSGNFNVTISGD
jgi:hypothetical protein